MTDPHLGEFRRFIEEEIENKVKMFDAVAVLAVATNLWECFQHDATFSNGMLRFADSGFKGILRLAVAGPRIAAGLDDDRIKMVEILLAHGDIRVDEEYHCAVLGSLPSIPEVDIESDDLTPLAFLLLSKGQSNEETPLRIAKILLQHGANPLRDIEASRTTGRGEMVSLDLVQYCVSYGRYVCLKLCPHLTAPSYPALKCRMYLKSF